jgi:hypothetical protein
MPLHGEMREEVLDRRAAEQSRMPEALGCLVKANEWFDPAEATLFGAIGIVFDAESLTDLFEQFHAHPTLGVCRLISLDEKRRNTRTR